MYYHKSLCMMFLLHLMYFGGKWEPIIYEMFTDRDVVEIIKISLLRLSHNDIDLEI